MPDALPITYSLFYLMPQLLWIKSLKLQIWPDPFRFLNLLFWLPFLPPSTSCSDHIRRMWLLTAYWKKPAVKSLQNPPPSFFLSLSPYTHNHTHTHTHKHVASGNQGTDHQVRVHIRLQASMPWTVAKCSYHSARRGQNVSRLKKWCRTNKHFQLEEACGDEVVLTWRWVPVSDCGRVGVSVLCTCAVVGRGEQVMITIKTPTEAPT